MRSAPSEFLCAWDGRLMMDPVVSPQGFAFERAGLVHALAKSGGCCPLTSEPLSLGDCTRCLDPELHPELPPSPNPRYPIPSPPNHLPTPPHPPWHSDSDIWAFRFRLIINRYCYLMLHASCLMTHGSWLTLHGHESSSIKYQVSISINY